MNKLFGENAVVGDRYPSNLMKYVVNYYAENWINL
jgi:hypothetical protein